VVQVWVDITSLYGCFYPVGMFAPLQESITPYSYQSYLALFSIKLKYQHDKESQAVL